MVFLKFRLSNWGGKASSFQILEQTGLPRGHLSVSLTQVFTLKSSSYPELRRNPNGHFVVFIRGDNPRSDYSASVTNSPISPIRLADNILKCLCSYTRKKLELIEAGGDIYIITEAIQNE